MVWSVNVQVFPRSRNCEKTDTSMGLWDCLGGRCSNQKVHFSALSSGSIALVK